MSALALACAALLAAAAGAQKPIPVPVDPRVPFGLTDLGAESRTSGRSTVQEPPAVGAVAADEAAAAELLTKWKQLVFDRRPSSVLAAWAAPELQPYDPAEELQKVDPEVRDLVIAELGVDPAEVAPTTVADEGEATAAEAKKLAQKRQQRELEMFARDVTLSRWDRVAEFLHAFPEKEQQGAYEHFLRTLPRHPQEQGGQRVPPNLQERNRFSFEEALVLAAMAPGGFTDEQVALLAPIVRRAIEDGSVIEELVRLLANEVARPEEQRRLRRRQAALLLAAIGQEIELGAFLPGRAVAERDDDREALNLLARFYLAKYAAEMREDWLEDAWFVTQAVLAAGEVGKEEKQEALLRAVELAPKVREELGPEWLEQSFTTRPERGMEIIATIGGEVSSGFARHAQDTDYRSKVLKLQKTAVEALLRAAPHLAEQWRPSLALLATSWIVEANYSRQYSQSVYYGQVPQRDQYGNIYWVNQRMGGGGAVQAVEPADLIDAQPGERWVALLDAELVPHFATTAAQLYLKVNEYERAFPFIEQLAAVNPRKARELADEFLQVWARNNNPNVANSRTSSFMFVYGSNRRGAAIPLTRSKQERSLADLAEWVVRLRRLPIGGVDQKLLGEAFMAAHSQAEVPQLETIERVFGDVGELEPRLLGELLMTMRANLATTWRRPDVQEAAKTRRGEKEMLEEVARGYETALALAERVTERQGEHWSLLVLTAAIRHDMNNFAREQKRDSDFGPQRLEALALFERAAYDYVRRAPELRLDRETIAPFDTWFYATIGACDLALVDESTAVAQSQLPKIEAALEALPDGSRERHLAMFANALITRMSGVAPQIKVRYLDAGFAVVGDHPQAQTARKTLEFYRDLLVELRLDCVVDGPTEVGTEEFGVRVDIVHTKNVEDSSGGFAKYTTNQLSTQNSYNYGRPPEDYRDRFEEGVRTALGEHFEVLSVTWNGQNMRSKPAGRDGWRRTPYAFLLLKARGPEIDRIPAIQIDLDFLDQTGYVVLPIGSSPVAIDASRGPGASRPCRDLTVTQLLDARHVGEGRLTLEVKAAAKGLVPDLDQVLELALPGLRVDRIDDQGSTVVKFADDQDSVETERVWLLTLVPADEAGMPSTFRFGAARANDIALVNQRYDDADLATVGAVVPLVGGLEQSPWWIWLVLASAFVVYLVWFFGTVPGGRAPRTEAVLLTLPAKITPFSVLGLLRAIEAQAPLDAGARAALADDIRAVETAHFGKGDESAPDLAALARAWLLRVG